MPGNVSQHLFLVFLATTHSLFSCLSPPLFFFSCVEQRNLWVMVMRAESIFSQPVIFWLMWDPGNEKVMQIVEHLRDWMTAGICQRWQVQTAVWHHQLMNNDWVEARQARKSISLLDRVHHSNILNSAKTPRGLRLLTSAQSFPV